MKNFQILLIAILFSFYGFSQTDPCGSLLNDTFDVDGALPSEWTEYNTSGRVTVNAGRLKFDHNTTMPSAYRTFDPITSKSTFSFDVTATRAAVDCRVHLVSSTGKHLSSIALGIGDATIKYATAIEDGVPSGFTSATPYVSFPNNTLFRLSAQVNFATETVNFYTNGELSMSDVPFLETAQDVSKIDIELLYMYANNGQFYFDNISLSNADENRLLLQNTVSEIESSLSSALVGDQYGEYSQSAVDAFQSVIDDANVVLINCNATSVIIDKALTDLEVAKDVFEASRVNDLVLKIYSEYDFSGDEHEMYNGYYNGTLGTHDDWAVSFKLDKGHMVTFAENVNGTGVSKVYVASEEDLMINLPADLQKKASFIRVSPWNDTHKRGASGKSDDVIVALSGSWFYDWGKDDVSTQDYEFVVMNWSGGTGLAKMEEVGSRMNITHHLAFNEPDAANQSKMTVDKAIEQYEILLATGLRLGAPAVTDGAKGRAWLDEFMIKATTAGYRIDFLPVHYYKKPTTASYYNWLKNLSDAYQIPLWVTEFNYGDIHDNPNLTEAQVLAGLSSFITMMDETSFVERYCVFTWQPSQTSGGGHSLMSVRTPLTLNSIGEYYANHESPVAYIQEIYEQGELLAVDFNSISSKVSIFPTVIADGILNLKYSQEIETSGTELTIYDSLGIQVKKTVINTKIDISTLSSGIYIINIKSDFGNLIEKIIIQ